MRVGELLRARVETADGTDLGRVHDVRVVQDGPTQGAVAAFRVDALVVGRAGVAVRLGAARRDLAGPWPLHHLLHALERRSRMIPWADVDHVDGRRVVLKADRQA